MASAQPLGSAVAAPGPILCFGVGRQTLALPIDVVERIVAWTPTKAMCATGYHSRGAIAFRGRLTPVLDWRVLYGEPPSEDESNAVLIVAHVDSDPNRLAATERPIRWVPLPPGRMARSAFSN